MRSAGLLMVLAAVLVASCTTPREVVVVRHDTTAVAYHVHDSIDRWRVRYVERTGDTIHVHDSVVVERWRVVQHDSVAIVHDTTSRVEVVEVERPLTWWQRARMDAAPPLAALVICLVAAFLVRRG